MKIIYGAGRYWGAEYRQRLFTSLWSNTLTLGWWRGCRWNIEALIHRPNLFDIFQQDIVKEVPDLIVSDEDPFTVKLAKSLSLPLITLSSRRGDVLHNVLLPQACRTPFPQRTTSERQDICLLMREGERVVKLTEMLDGMNLSYSAHREIDEDFWAKEKQSSVFICSGDWESIEIGLTNNRPFLVVPDVSDEEQVFNVQLARNLKIRSLGQIDLLPRYGVEVLKKSLDEVEVIPVTMPDRTFKDVVEERIDDVCGGF